ESLPAENGKSGIAWLLGNQNADGGWGGERGTPSSIEETSLAVEALANFVENSGSRDAVERGVAWLIEHTSRGITFPPSPIGFYFAKLWYFEKLYPLVWTVSALGRTAKVLAERRV